MEALSVNQTRLGHNKFRQKPMGCVKYKFGHKRIYHRECYFSASKKEKTMPRSVVWVISYPASGSLSRTNKNPMTLNKTQIHIHKYRPSLVKASSEFDVFFIFVGELLRGGE